MKKSNGASRLVLGYIRNTNFFESYIPSAVAKPTGKQGKKRKIVGSGVSMRGGKWVGVVAA